MANIWICHVTVLLLVLSGIAEAESSIEQNDRESHDAVQSHFAHDEAKRREAWSAPLSSPQKRRATSEEDDDGSDISAAYLRALAGDDDDDEKRARSSFRGDLGKRMMHAMSHGMSSDAAGYQAPDFWAAAAADEKKRFKVSSRFRGDLGKRAKSSFRGDLGKRFQSRYATSDDFTDGRIPKFETSGRFVRIILDLLVNF